MLTPFQHYVHERWLRDFPQWARLREDLDADGPPDRLTIRYVIPSPVDEANLLYVVFTHDEILVKFAVPGSHEHYDSELYVSADENRPESEKWELAYAAAHDEYIRPVLEDRLIAVWYDKGSALVPDVALFTTQSKIASCRCESWTRKYQFRSTE